MTLRRAGILCLALAANPSAGADEAELAASGAMLFERNCSVCHGDAGGGQAPVFPALAGNDVLADLPLIVGNMHLGVGYMPPFPELSAEEIAALATYIRTSWGNAAGAVTVAEVSLLLEGLDAGAPTRTIWDGVYGSAQAARGRLAYDGQCALCHGRRLNGAAEDPDMQSGPPLARVKFLREWDGRSLAVLFDYTRAAMPLANPGSLSDGQSADIVAYMLSVSGAPPGPEDMGTDREALARITIAAEE